MAQSYVEEAARKYDERLKAGRKILSDKTAAGENGYLPTLTEKLKGIRTDGELAIGIREILLKKIIGTYAAGRSAAFAAGFLPILPPNSEFGSKWRALYASHMKEGIREHIKVYEYLGYYYVVEGNKRVSVLNAVGAYSIHADVTRIIPHRSDDPEVKIYYEFYDFDKRRLFDNMWFSRAGRFPKLIKWARDYAGDKPELAEDAELKWMFECFGDFRRRYNELGYGAAKHTTADAFYEYVSIFGFPYGMTPGEMTQAVEKCLPQFRLINTEEYDVTGDINLNPMQEKRASTFSNLLSRRETALIALALPDSPDFPGWSRTHAFAARQAAAAFKDKAELIVASPGIGQSEYDMLTALAEKKPGLLLAAGPEMHKAALRMSLESPDTIVALCSPYIKMDSLSTYFFRFYEAAYICGALAGALSVSDVVGIISQPKGSWMTLSDVNAFAAGARLVNPRAECMVCFAEFGSRGCGTSAKKLLAQSGADVMLSTCPGDGPVIGRLTDDIGAALCSVQRDSGNIKEYFAGISFNWEAYYNPMFFELTEGTLESSVKNSDIRPAHFRWGIGSGAIDILTVDNAIGSYPVRLTRLFADMVKKGLIDPLADPLGHIDMHQGILCAASQNKLLSFIQDITPVE